VPFSFDLTQALVAHPMCNQFRESELAFFQRVLTSESLSFRFAHD
jgi:type VI secretion system secreted protein VgrG